MSRLSSGVVTANERLARFAFHPIHLDKKGRLKPSIFSHAETKGCSVQREGHAADDEIANFASTFLSSRDDRTWKGVLIASYQDLRDIRAASDPGQLICVYDTAEQDNPAHAEFGWSRTPLEEADPNEIRAGLMRAFGNAALITPGQYRGGAVLQRLTAELRSRC
jgi:hypothetical protein